MMALRSIRFPYGIIDKWKLVGKNTGCAPWEVQYILDKCEQHRGHIVEIGTNRGGTTAEIADAFPTREIHTVDCNLPVYGLNEEDIGAECKSCNNVQLHRMDSKDFHHPQGTGVIFIDGDHTWEGVKADTEKALAHYRNHRGIIIWHDYTPEFEVWPYLGWLRHNMHWDIAQVDMTSLAVLVL